MDVAAWLRGLGLEQYAPAFRDNEIDGDALPKLTAEDLKELGVVLAATAAGCSTRSPRSAPPVPAASATAASLPLHRRQPRPNAGS